MSLTEQLIPSDSRQPNVKGFMTRNLFIRYIKTQPKTNIFRFYVYFYLRDKDSDTGKKGTVYYCGKGQLDRAWQPHRKIPVPKDLSNIVIIAYDLSEVGAFALERRYIEWYGRKNIDTGILLNLSEGGEGATGHKLTKEQLKNRSGENSPIYGTIRSNDTRKAMSVSKTGANNPMYGKKRTDEHIRNYAKSCRMKIQILCIGTGDIFEGPAYACDWLKSIGFLKAQPNNITSCCNGKFEKAYGYTWKYA